MSRYTEVRLRKKERKKEKKERKKERHQKWVTMDTVIILRVSLQQQIYKPN